MPLGEKSARKPIVPWCRLGLSEQPHTQSSLGYNTQADPVTLYNFFFDTEAILYSSCCKMPLNQLALVLV